MLKTRVLPCLLIKNGRLVKTVKFNEPVYIGDPINAVKIYNEKEVDELIILDINATIESKSPPFELLSGLTCECFMPFTYGGGIKTVDDIKKLFNIGIEKIAINSHAIEHPSFIEKTANLFGSQSIVVSIDVKKSFLGKYSVYSNGARIKTHWDPVTYACNMEKMGAGEILLTSIDQDGMMNGYDLELLKKVTNAVTIPVIACGGAGDINHFTDAVRIGGASAVAAGSLVVYQGKKRGVLINFPSSNSLKSVLD